MIMKRFLLYLLICQIYAAQAQTELQKQSVDNGGAIAENGSVKMLFTIGETAVQETTNGTIQISEGFIGPAINLALALQDYTELAGIKVFPNPIMDILQITFAEDAYYTLTLYDLNGKEIKNISTQGSANLLLDVKDLQDAVYLLLVTDTENQRMKVIKVVKK